MRKEPLLITVFFVALVLIWGSAFILIKKSLLYFSPLEVGAGRIFFAALTLSPFAWKELKSVDRKDILLIVSSGVLGSFIPAILYALAQAKVASAYAAVMSGLTPVFTILVGLLFYAQSLVLLQVLGVLLSFGGAAFLMLQGQTIGGVQWLPSLLVVAATLCYALNVNLVKYKLKHVHPLKIAVISLTLISPLAVLILSYQGFFQFNFSDNQFVHSFSALAVLGITSTAIGLVIFNKLLKIASPILASSVTYVIPLVALAWGVVDGEQVAIHHLLGMVLIFSGVYLIAKR